MKRFLQNHEKIVILGIGNELRGDDALGSIIARKLSILFDKRDDIVVFDGGTVPENYTGSLRKEDPSHIILVDAVDMKEKPGYIRMVEKEEIGSYNISTHAMPLSFLIKYLESTTDAQMILVGIQPKNMDINQDISKEIKESIRDVVDIFNNVV